MRKDEFLAALQNELAETTPEDRKKWVDFCGEMIDDRMEDGLTEEEAVAAAGSPQQIAEQIRAELPQIPPASFPEKSVFGQTTCIYTAENVVCGVLADCGPADFEILPAENGTCRVECTENESVHYAVTTENAVVHIRRADSRSLLSLFKFFPQQHETIRVYLPQGAYKTLDVKTVSGDVTVSSGYAFDTVSLHSTSGDFAVYADAAALSAHTVSGDIQMENARADTLSLHSTSGNAVLKNICAQKNVSITTSSGKVQLASVTGGTVETESASGKVCLENVRCAALHIETASGKADLFRTETSGSTEIDTASGSIHLERCDAASLRLESMSGSISGTLKTGKCFRAKSTSGKVSVPPDYGENLCCAETRSGSIRLQIAE